MCSKACTFVVELGADLEKPGNAHCPADYVALTERVDSLMCPNVVS